MMNFKIGSVYKINNKFIEVIHNEDVFSRPVSSGNGLSLVGMLNSYVSIPLYNSNRGIGIVFEQYEPKKDNQELFDSNYNSDIVISRIRIIGTYNPIRNEFSKGLDFQPTLGAEVFNVDESTLKNIYDSTTKGENPALIIGNDINFKQIPISANPNALLGKHFAVFGNTGTGKSCTVTSILQSVYTDTGRLLNSDQPSLKTIIIDSNNEYSNILDSMDNADVVKINVDDLKLSHKDLNFLEICQLLKEESPNVLPYLRSAIQSLKERPNVDEEVYYDFSELPDAIIEEINEANDDRNASFVRGYCGHMINRINGFISDSRYDCIFQTDQNSIIDFLDSDSKVLILSLQTANDVLSTINYLICKTIYSYKKTKRDADNLLLVLEEAHRYISQESNDLINNYYIEKVAREGRKFGVNICVSTQRPSEVSHTVVSQCNSLLVHKLTNYRDLEFIRNTIEYEDRSQIDLISGLKQQEALVLGDAFTFSTLVKISTADPIPKSETPTIFNYQ